MNAIDADPAGRRRESGPMTPYYEHAGITIYHGSCLDVLDAVGWVDAVVTDPPYPNGAGHFMEAIPVALEVFARFVAPRWFVFWSQLDRPPVRLPLVARHIWHRTNTNRPDNYEAIYEFAAESERHSRVFAHAVVYPGLTGCVEATGHPTQKPEALMRQLISLRAGVETVFDPFMGSGTTLVAAKRLGKRAIGCEVDEKHCADAVARLSQEALPKGVEREPQATEPDLLAFVREIAELLRFRRGGGTQQVCEDCGARFADRAPDAKWATETLCWNCFSRRSARRRGEG